MQVELTAKNFRCFPDECPLRIALGPGFTSFVGVNNAGKSAILRMFWEFRPLFERLAANSANNHRALKGQHEKFYVPVAAGEEYGSKLNTREVTLTFEWSAAHNSRLAKHSMRVALTRDSQYTLSLTLDGEGVEGDFTWSHDRLETADQGVVDLGPFRQACRWLNDSIYVGPFRNTINTGGNADYFDIAVGSEFVKRFQAFKSGSNPAANEAVYQLIEDIRRIFGFQHFDINADPDNGAMQVFVDGRSFRLAELGTGIAQFILVLANVLVRRPTAVFIDEPEAHLHPTLQLDFLTTLASYTSEGSVFFATHNLGLARTASDRVYSCRRRALGVCEVHLLEGTPHLAEFLGELGFSAYRDLGFESVLLVEGPTEVKTLQQLLRKWQKDHEMVLLQLGGASLINGHSEAELNEIMRISGSVAAIIDSERLGTSSPLDADRAAFVQTCETLGIQVLVLERRALENYFTDPAVKAALGESYSALDPYQRLKDAEKGWSKRDNWRIAQHLDRSELEATDLGRFLQDL